MSFTIEERNKAITKSITFTEDCSSCSHSYDEYDEDNWDLACTVWYCNVNCYEICNKYKSMKEELDDS